MHLSLNWENLTARTSFCKLNCNGFHLLGSCRPHNTGQDNKYDHIVTTRLGRLSPDAEQTLGDQLCARAQRRGGRSPARRGEARPEQLGPQGWRWRFPNPLTGMRLRQGCGRRSGALRLLVAHASSPSLPGRPLERPGRHRAQRLTRTESRRAGSPALRPSAAPGISGAPPEVKRQRSASEQCLEPRFAGERSLLQLRSVALRTAAPLHKHCFLPPSLPLA